MENTKKNNAFFAAANTFNGFRSFFDKVFKSEEYERIYVLKGGPGTGKSSLMKRIANEAIENGAEVTKILCSSDPHSLDGIIIKNQDKKVAILDGTAPHERDAVIAGAVDEIIDLGRCWNSKWLVAQREKITELSVEKKKAYFTAYSYLSLAGKSEEFISSIYKDKFLISKAKDKAEQFLTDFSSISNSKEIKCLVSSFGRYGKYSLDTFISKAKRKITLGEDSILNELFLKEIVDLLRGKEIEFYNLISPLNTEITEGIFIPGEEILITGGKEGEFNLNEILSDSGYGREQIKCALNSYRAFLDEAERWFAIASDLHFRLEEIYSAAMDFKKNDEIIEEKTVEILQILDL